MRLEDMSFTDYLMAEYDLRERQRKERMKQAEFEQYAKEHGYIISTTNIIEQIRDEIEKLEPFDSLYDYSDVIKDVLEVFDKYAK